MITVEDISKAYADFESKNKKMLDKLAEDNNKIFSGYTVDTFIDILNKLYACENNPYMLSRVSDKNKVLLLCDIISLSNIMRDYFAGKVNVNELNIVLFDYGMVFAGNPDVRDCNIAIYGISEKTQRLLTKFMCENNLEFSCIEGTTNNAPCKRVVKDKDNEAIVPAGMPIAECEALFKENRGAE